MNIFGSIVFVILLTLVVSLLGYEVYSLIKAIRHRRSLNKDKNEKKGE